MRQGRSDLSGSQSALAFLCVCARAQLGLREFNTGGFEMAEAFGIKSKKKTKAEEYEIIMQIPYIA
jgi:hypothetical protein